jgi:DNA-binding response OmpR family regulator/HPt (histidine-containing phosphotransfer) domain-containing protein
MRVLVVDDDEMSRELLTVLLDAEGYTVDSADSGEAALSLLRQSNSTPDLILTDMQLPGISGSELARGLRDACGASTLLLAISGSQPTAEALSEFDGFLLKPFRMEEVAAALRTRSLAERAKSTPPVGAKIAAKRSTKNPALGSAGTAARRARKPSVTSKHASAAAPRLQSASNKEMNAGRQTGVITQEADDGEGALPALNETIFQQLARTMLSSQLQEMYMLCLTDARQRIAGMRKLAANHDGVRFVREAHAIKGGSGMLGATELHRKAADLESHGLASGAQGGLEDVNSLDELSAACDRLERMLGSRL